MADLMEIARQSRARRRRESRGSKESKESPPSGGSGTSFDCFSCFPCGPVPWDQREALRLIEDADALVERFGVSGTISEVRAAAGAVSSAFATRDLETLRRACAEFEDTILQIRRRRAVTKDERAP